MMTRETFTQNTLTIELTHSENEVRLDWRGKSNDRHPEAFLVPVMLKAFECSEAGRLPVVLDFRAVEYMNSSTFTPLVKMLEQAARGPYQLRLEYDGARKWQTLSFSALKAFETADGRVCVHAK